MATRPVYPATPRLTIAEVTTSGGTALRNPTSVTNSTVVFTSQASASGSLLRRLRIKHIAAVGAGAPTASTLIYVYVASTSVSTGIEMLYEFPVPAVEGGLVIANFNTEWIWDGAGAVLKETQSQTYPGLVLPSNYVVRVGLTGTNVSVDTYSCTAEGVDF